jgi:hypothetical protein
MKPKPDFDLDWPASSSCRHWPVRSIWQLMAVVAASGLFLAVTVPLARQPLASIIYWDPGLPPASSAPPRLVFYPAPALEQDSLVIACPAEAPQPPVIQAQPRDRTVVIAPESIDPGMVVRAPAWIDPKMVFTPGGADAQAEQGELPELAPRVPGIAPGTGPQYKVIPVPDPSSPPAKRPQYKVVPVPDPSSPPAKRPQQKLVR